MINYYPMFFDELEIRKLDYILETGKNGGTHYNKLSYLSVAILELIKKENFKNIFELRKI